MAIKKGLFRATLSEIQGNLSNKGFSLFKLVEEKKKTKLNVCSTHAFVFLSIYSLYSVSPSTILLA